MVPTQEGAPPVRARDLWPLNLDVVQFVRETWDLPSEVWGRVENPAGKREVHIVGGKLVGGTSTLPEDQLGTILAEEGRYDLNLLGPMTREAEARRIPFGELLVSDGLLSPNELQEVLEQQSATRLLRMLTMPGLVTIGRGASTQVAGRPLGALVVEFFRTELSIPALGALVAELEQQRLRFTSTADRVAGLALTEEDFFLIVRDPVVQGREPFEIARLPEPRLRLICALVAVGILEHQR